MEAPVAATIPTLPSSPMKKEIPRRIPNLGTRLKPTPIRRGPKPERDAPLDSLERLILLLEMQL